MKRFGLDVPEAHLCRNIEDVRSLDLSREWAVKPVYGRASTKVHHLKPGKPFTVDIAMLTMIIITLPRSGCQASDIAATVLSVTVEPKRRVSIQSWTRSMVARPFTSSSNTVIRLYEYIEKLAARLLTVAAQLAFDFIEIGNRLVVMECNPWATSGIHLWSDTPFLAQALTDTLSNKDKFTEPHGSRLGLPARRGVLPGTLMWEHEKAGAKQYFRHMSRLMGTKDVVWKTRDLMPSLMQPFLLTSYYKICRERDLSLPDMFQWDMVWEPDAEYLDRVRRLSDEADERDDRGKNSCKKDDRWDVSYG